MRSPTSTWLSPSWWPRLPPTLLWSRRCDLDIRGVQWFTAVGATDLGRGQMVAPAVVDQGRGPGLRGRPGVSPGADGQEDVAQLPTLVGEDVVESLGPLPVGTL